MAKIIGRKQEVEELLRLYNRPENQLVTVRGRRRVGKTFLIRETFKNKFAFYKSLYGCNLPTIRAVWGLSPIRVRSYWTN